MKIVIPYTAKHLLTIQAAPGRAEWHYVGDDDEAYWRLMCELWNCGDDLLLIEHDVVCRPDVVAGMETCPEPWCGNGYANICHTEPWYDNDGILHESCMDAWKNFLGCTRFRKELMAAVPDAATAIPEGYGRNWHNLCDYLATGVSNGSTGSIPPLPNSIRGRGFTHHWHFPPVEHHHMSLVGMIV